MDKTLTLSDEEILIVLNGLWHTITENRKKNISDLSDESQPIWDLREKISKVYAEKRKSNKMIYCDWCRRYHVKDYVKCGE